MKQVQVLNEIRIRTHTVVPSSSKTLCIVSIVDILEMILISFSEITILEIPINRRRNMLRNSPR